MKDKTSADPLGTDDEMLDHLLRDTFTYFTKERNPKNGLVADKSQPGSPSSIAATGLCLTVYIVAAKRGLMSREDAINEILTVLRFFKSSSQGPEPNATGYRGFYYHFLDMETGERARECELSTIDSAFFMAGALTAAYYFTKDTKKENEIRELADALYKRMDWQWILNGTATICHGWKPDSGFLSYYWDRDYSEAMILYVLALGSPSFSIGKEGYDEWTSTFKLKKIYDIEHLYAGPLFIHQLSHIWIDFRNIHDEFNKKSGIDYFENSRRATLVQRAYAIENKEGFAHYGKYCWGFTASDGPGPAMLQIEGKQREFYNYIARGAPYGPDDGTVAPWAVVGSLPFAPEIVVDTLRHAIERLKLKRKNRSGFDASFNPTFPSKKKNPNGWVAPWKFGLNEGPIILMIENYQSGLIWEIMKQCPYIINGLYKAGFRGGWIDELKKS